MNALDTNHGHGGPQNVIFANKANFNSQKNQANPLDKIAHDERRFRTKSFASNKHSAHDERFLPGPNILTAIFPSAVRSLDHSDRSCVIVVSIPYETSVRSFFLRVQKEGV